MLLAYCSEPNIMASKMESHVLPIFTQPYSQGSLLCRLFWLHGVHEVWEDLLRQHADRKETQERMQIKEEKRGSLRKASRFVRY